MYKGEQCVKEQRLASLVWAFAWGEGPGVLTWSQGQDEATADTVLSSILSETTPPLVFCGIQISPDK